MAEHAYRRESDVVLEKFRQEQARQSGVIDSLCEAVEMNREAVADLAQEFRDHDALEVADRRERAEIDKQLTAGIVDLRQTIAEHSATFAEYQKKMQPIEDSVDWVRISKKILLWLASVAGAAFALVEVFARLGGGA